MDAVFARIDDLGSPAWYLTDNLGSVRDLIDNSAGLLDHLDYTPFGRIAGETNPTTGDRYKYTAREWDTETQLQYNRARYYDPATRRWISQDPLGFDAGDGNLYRYVHNRSLTQVDPTGLQQGMGFYYGEALARIRAWRRMQGLGTFPAASFFEIGMGGRVFEGARSFGEVFGQMILQEGRLTRQALTYQKGCVGLLELRLGKSPYDATNHFYTDLQDALKKLKELRRQGKQVRIFAIQFDAELTKYWKQTKKEDDGSRVELRLPTPGGNHATWHQVRPGFGFWEWLGRTGWAGENFYRGAVSRFVSHRKRLPAYENTVYGVAEVKTHKWLPPANGPIRPTRAPRPRE